MSLFNFFHQEPKPSINILGRASRIHYTCGGRSIHVDSELLTGPSLVLYASSIKTWDNGTPVTAGEKLRIIGDIEDLLWREWGTIEVDYGDSDQSTP